MWWWVVIGQFDNIAISAQLRLGLGLSLPKIPNNEFSQSSQVHKKGAQKGLKTPFRPYIFRKIFTKFPSSEKGGGSRFLTLFPSSQSSQPPQGGGGQRGLGIFPKFSRFRVLKASLTQLAQGLDAYSLGMSVRRLLTW